jgi:hypothetical protein
MPDGPHRSIGKLENEIGTKIAIEDISPGTDKITVFKNNTINEHYLDLRKINTEQLAQYKSNIKINTFGDVQDIPHDSAWNKKIDEIDPKEIVECFAINQLIPTLLINSLKPKLKSPKFIIQVTSLEGQFNHAAKTDKHIHTNMCKASMDMLIRSLSESDDVNLMVHSINPGYVTGICPQEDEYYYPVGLEDAASKIVYPIIKFFNGEKLDKSYTKMQCYEPMDW